MQSLNVRPGTAQYAVQRYLALVDWPRRLQREEPFFRKWFGDVEARKVLDVACGTGHHARMFESWGLTVEGADVDSAMIDFCREQQASRDTLSWHVRSFTEPSTQPGTFDVAMCIGNSLLLAGHISEAAVAFTRMFEAVRPGGIAILQVLNLQRFEPNTLEWQRCKRVRLLDREMLMLKGIQRLNGHARLEFVEMTPDGQLLGSRSRELLSLGAEELQDLARSHGARSIALYGDYLEGRFDAGTSQDAIVVARAP